MNKRMKKKLMREYEVYWRPDANRWNRPDAVNLWNPVLLRSERVEKGKYPVTFMDWSKFVRRHYYNPPRYNRLRPILAEYSLREVFVGTPEGEFKSGKRFIVFLRSSGIPLTVEEYREFLKLIGMSWFPYELGKLLITNGTIHQGDDILPDLPEEDLEDEGDWCGEWDDLPGDDDCEFCF